MRAQQQCTQFLKAIMSNKNAGPFNEPVDFVALGVPDYPNIIKHPMDFGTVEGQLAAAKYDSVEHLAADCRLVFSNARTFNPPDHIIHKMATDLSKFFEKKYSSLQTKLESHDLSGGGAGGGGGGGGATKEFFKVCKRMLKNVQEHPEA